MVAVVTCIDPRLTELIEPALGIRPGTAYIVRTAGAFFGPAGEVMLSLKLAVERLGVRRICVVGHTDCRAVQVFGWSEQEVVQKGLDVIRAEAHFPPDLSLEGYVLCLSTGALEPVSDAIVSHEVPST